MVFDHVRAGQRWQPKEVELNAMLDAGREFSSAQGVRTAGQGSGVPVNPLVIRVQNKTGSTVERYRAFAVKSSMWDLNVNNNIAECVFRLDSWAEGDSIAIVQQALAVDAVGLAVISGPTLADITGGGSASDRRAKPSSNGRLIAGEGPIKITGPRPNGGGIVLAILGAGGEEATAIFLTTTDIGFSSGTVPFTWGMGQGKKILPNGTLASELTNLRNTVKGRILANTVVQAKLIYGQYVIDVVDCPEPDDDGDDGLNPGPGTGPSQISLNPEV